MCPDPAIQRARPDSRWSPPRWGPQRVMLSTLLEENGFRVCSAVLVSFSAESVLTRAFSPAYTWFEMGYMGRWGTQLFDGFALGCEHLTPHPVPERPGAEQTGPDPAGMAFASSQRAPPTHTHLQRGGSPLCASAGVTCGLRAGRRAWEPDRRVGSPSSEGQGGGQAVSSLLS